MLKEWVVQAELNGRFGAVRRSDANGTRSDVILEKWTVF